MKCLVVGPGGMGLVFGAGLIAAGHEVAFAARTPFTQVSVGERGEPALTYSAAVYTDPASTPDDFDWVLLSTKAHQTSSVAGWLNKAPRVAILQNGVEHVARVAAHVRPDATVVPAVVGISGTRTAPGEAYYIKRPDTDLITDSTALADLFSGSFIATEMTDDIRTRLWRKLCWNASTGAILALTRGRMGVFRDASVAASGQRILEETVAVARADGARLPDDIVEKLMESFRTSPADEFNSMVMDVEAGVECEWDARNAVLCRLGRKHGVPTPVSDLLVPLLSVLHKSTQG